MKKKKKVKFNRLSADQRPLFPVMHKVQTNEKDKERNRSYQKRKLKKDLMEENY